MVGFVSERLSQNYGDVKLLGGFSLRRCCSEVFNCAMHNRLGFVQNYCHIDLPGLQDSMVLNGEESAMSVRIRGCLYRATISQPKDWVGS